MMGEGARESAKTASFGLVVGHMPTIVPGDVLPVSIRASMRFLPCFRIRRRGVSACLAGARNDLARIQDISIWPLMVAWPAGTVLGLLVASF